MCPFHHRRPFFAESKSFAKVIAGLHRFLVPLFSKTRSLSGEIWRKAREVLIRHATCRMLHHDDPPRSGGCVTSAETHHPGPIVPLLFGRFLLKTGWVTPPQLDRALTLQSKLTPSVGLVSVLRAMLRMEELQRVLAYQHQTGALFLEAVQQLGLLDAPQLAVLTAHASSTLLLGAALCLQGHLSVADLEEALGDFDHYHTTGELRPCRSHPEKEADHGVTPQALGSLGHPQDGLERLEGRAG